MKAARTDKKPKLPAPKFEAALKTGEAEGELELEETELDPELEPDPEPEAELDGVAALVAEIRLLVRSGQLDTSPTEKQDMKTYPEVVAEVVFEVVEAVEAVDLPEAVEEVELVSEVELTEPVNLILS